MTMAEDSKREERISRNAVIAMLAIVAALVVVAAYANWQNLHRDVIETTTTIRIAPAASPSASP
jgi:uncharacterized membrane protein YidH (DUF202 family)